MRQSNEIFVLPRKNDLSAIEAHKSTVLSHFGELFGEVDFALQSALPKVKSTFALHEGPVDLAVHAPWTRYLVRLALSQKSNEVFDDDDVDFDLLRVSNCGLCIRTDFGDIRILKSPADGLPKALSDARVSFVMNNQMEFAFAEEKEQQAHTLNLFVLWRMDANHEYLGMDIACPRHTRDKGEIECYWIAPWRKSDGVHLSIPMAPVTPSDLDEIVAVPARDKQSSK